MIRLLQPLLWLSFLGISLSNGLGPGSNVIFGANYISFLALGVAVMLLTLAAFTAGSAFVFDKTTGMTKLFLLLPIPRISIVIGNGLGVTIESLLQALLLLLIAVPLGATYVLSAVAVSMFLIMAFLITFGIYGVSTAFASRFKDPSLFLRIFAVVAAPFMLGSGTLAPVTYLPEALRVFASFSPITHALAVMRYFLLGPSAAGLGAIWNSLGIDAGLNGLILSISYVISFAFGALMVAWISIRKMTPI